MSFILCSSRVETCWNWEEVNVLLLSSLVRFRGGVIMVSEYISGKNDVFNEMATIIRKRIR